MAPNRDSRDRFVKAGSPVAGIQGTSQIIGMPELLRKLDALPAELRGPAAADALMAGALPIQNAWKEKAPVETGQYQQSIHPEVVQGSGSEVWVELGTDIVDPPYPFFLEFGTSKMPPHPSMRPAFDEQKDAAIAEVGDVIMTIVGKYTE